MGQKTKTIGAGLGTADDGCSRAVWLDLVVCPRPRHQDVAASRAGASFVWSVGIFAQRNQKV
jgi:hypothetical protein